MVEYHWNVLVIVNGVDKVTINGVQSPEVDKYNLRREQVTPVHELLEQVRI